MKECTIKREGAELTVKIQCEIDHHTAKFIREAVDMALFEKPLTVLELDFSRVSFMDSSGIGLILGRASKAEELGARVEIVGLSGALRKLVCMSGVERISNVTVK